jgi:hypothetical protein
MKIIVIKVYKDIFKLVVSELWAMIGLILYSLCLYVVFHLLW